MRICLRHLLLSTSSPFGVYVAYREIAWFWSANASTASDGHIPSLALSVAGA